MSEAGDKTEKPTPKKLRELRKKGIVLRSQEMPQAISLLALVVALPMALKNLTATYSALMASTLSAAGDTDLAMAGQLGRAMLLAGAKALALPVTLVMGSIVLTNVVLARERPNPKLLKPRFETLSPKAGIKRVFGPHGLTELAKTVGKLALMCLIAYQAWHHGITHLVNSAAPLDSIIHAATTTTRSLLLQVAVVGVLIGVLDVAFGVRRHRKQARMTKQEVRDESKQQEVNPEVRQAIRAKQMKLSRMRMIAAVGESDVVLVNPTHIAVALKYEQGTFAPKVVAKGAGVVAQRIREKAEEAGVPIMRNVPLARALHGSCEIGDSIPVELFRAVAEVLATVFATRRRHSGSPRQARAQASPGRPSGVPSPRPAGDARSGAGTVDRPSL